MVHHATELIRKSFEEHKLKFRVGEKGTASFVEAGFTPKNGNLLRAHFISPDEDNDVAVRVQVMSVQDDKVVPILSAINELNSKFLYVKFALDSDQNVMLHYDLPLKASDDCLGEIAVEIFVRIMKIMDEAYPTLMKTMWA